MAGESAESAMPVPGPLAKKRGPKSRADIEAEIETEMRARIEAEVRTRIEQETREALAAKDSEIAAARAQVDDAAAESRRMVEEARLVREAADSTYLPAEKVDADPTIEGSRTIHFVRDGMTILGRVWYQGENLTLVPGTANWNESIVIFGGARIPLVEMDEDTQIAKWGDRFFRDGPWRGKRWDEIEAAPLNEGEDPSILLAEKQALLVAQQKRAQQYGQGIAQSVSTM